MGTEQTSSRNNYIDDSLFKDEIDIKEIIAYFLRNKITIGTFAFIGLIFGGINAFTSPKTWQGEFQIVVQDNSSVNKLNNLVPFNMILGIQEPVDQLQTEVGILKSPSVLMNVFEFVKNQKALKNNALGKNFKFKDWSKEALDIELESGTSILNLAYRDSDKSLILPVLESISSSYQQYSGRKRIKNIELGMDYFSNQMEIYKQKSINSQNELTTFANKYDLSSTQSSLDSSNANINQISIAIEDERIKAAKQIRYIDKLLINIQELNKESPFNIINFTYNLNEYNDEDTTLAIINSLDEKLVELRLTFKEEDSLIQDLLQRKLFFTNLLNKRVKGFLLAKKEKARSVIEASHRPEGVLLKYKELLRQAIKDDFTFDELEDQYRLLSIEKARSEEPWELITDPTLLPTPIAPNKKRRVAIGLLAGFLAGLGFSYQIERKKDKIYSKKNMISLLGCPFFIELFINKNKIFEDSLNLLLSGPISYSDGSIALIPIGEIQDSDLNKIVDYLANRMSSRKFIITKYLSDAINYSNILVITSLGITTRNEVIDFNSKISTQNKETLGLLLINDLNIDSK
ncbi:GumC family protein [Prochlorococcus marinus]|uniref:GumC family protein n=1 Tax=Prochlorococcus marinus TaxID=1219 RepID=UPI0039AF0A26